MMSYVSGVFLPEKMRGQKTEQYIHIADWFATLRYLTGFVPKGERDAKATDQWTIQDSDWNSLRSSIRLVGLDLTTLILHTGPEGITAKQECMQHWLSIQRNGRSRREEQSKTCKININ